MKTFLLLLAFCLPLHAAEEDKQALRDLSAIYEKAIADRDLSKLKPHVADDFTGVMITADEVKGFDGIVAYWGKVQEFLGKGGTYQVDIEPDDTIFEGENIAIAKGRAVENVTLGSGKKLEFVSKWTAVARKEGGMWKLVRIHAAIDPIHNPIVESMQRLKISVFGAGGLLAGLIIGFLLWRRKKPA